MIPLSVPNLAGNEWKYVKDCLDTGWISMVGAYVNQFEEQVAAFVGARYGVATMNGTSALHIALQLAGVGPDDYVLLPNITFIASANAIKYTGADPILIDVHPDTWQMDLDLLEDFLEKQAFYKNNHYYLRQDGRRIASVMPVHVLGNMCDMERLMQIAKRYCLAVVEDSTEALGSTQRGRHAGTFGLFGTCSFNGNKIISTGGGGLILTNDENLARKAKHLTTQAKTDPFEYVHDEIGYNYRLVNILAAVGIAQMEQLPAFLERKQVIDRRYRDAIEGHADYRFQTISPHTKPNNWLHTMQTQQQRGLIQHLLAQDIQCRPFWMPMNQLRMFKNDMYAQKQDHSDHIYKTCLSIPSSTSLSDTQQDQVIEAILAYQP